MYDEGRGQAEERKGEAKNKIKINKRTKKEGPDLTFENKQTNKQRISKRETGEEPGHCCNLK